MKTYWQESTGQPSLGDELAALALKKMYDITAVRHPLAEADLASGGNVLDRVWEHQENAERSKKLHVVGSRFMKPETPLTPRSFLHIHSVRGYLSKNKLGKMDSPAITVGDPGLLAPEYVHVSSSQAPRNIGVVFHSSSADDEVLKEEFGHLPVEFIDIRTSDIDSFISQLASCAIILSQSLQGLILADAFGIPNAWLTLGSVHPGGSYRFYDYFSTVGRSFYSRVDEIPKTTADIYQAGFVADESRLQKLRSDITAAYDNALRDIH